MRSTRHALLAGLALWLLLGLTAGAAPAVSAEAWQSKRTFYLIPQLDPSGSARLVYRLLDPQGQVIGEPIEKPPTEPLGGVQVPPLPGIYTFEERSEDAAGNTLGTATTALPFDDVVPLPPVTRPPDGWVIGTEPVALELEPPAGPLPISGIRGYQLTLDQGDVRFESPADSISLGFLPDGIHRVDVEAVSGSGVHSEARTVTLAVDATVPSVSLQGMPAGWGSGPVKLTAIAHDPLSGMEPAGPNGPLTAIAVDGGSPTTAFGAAASTWVGGSGVHPVRFYGRDAAGNVGDGGPGSPPPQTALVRIDEDAPRVEFTAAQEASGTNRSHGGRMVLVNPLKTPVTLRAGLAGTHLSGSLRRSSGGPVAGQAVAVTESFAAGSDRQRRTTEVRTAADGTFSLKLKPGPSREVAASFGGTRLLSRASSPAVHLATAARIRFHASAAAAAIGGRPVVFSGRVAAPGASGALAGLPVELQFSYPGAGWSEFRTVEADKRGRFRFAYRFSDDDSRGVRFRFRAYVKGREGWPFGPSASRPVSVRGR
jgi:hypothetical protein